MCTRIHTQNDAILRGALHEFSLLQINSVVAVAKKVEARNDGRSPKEHVESESIVTSETVIQSRDKEYDRTDLTEQSHRTERVVRQSFRNRALGGSCLALFGVANIGPLPKIPASVVYLNRRNFLKFEWDFGKPRTAMMQPSLATTCSKRVPSLSMTDTIW